MAKDTDISLQNKVIYSVYVRNHTNEGTFNAIIPDLDRIKSLNVDYIWFMPIHPIGVIGRKGSLGCPYANKDYRTVNPEYGTIDDFKNLVNGIHKHGMKVMIDVVYNHTSPDSTLVKEHPEFFYKKADGSFGNKVGEWSDVVDLDYNNKDLWEYQIESLKYWAGIVDGFRCDVASFVPVDFWSKAREEVAKIHPGFIWLAESVHRGFRVYAMQKGINAASDNDLYKAFDICYEYDLRQAFDDYLDGKITLNHYADLLNFQEAAYPRNYNKLRYLENHDTYRIKSKIKNEDTLRNYIAWMYFNKGTTLIYAGVEYENDFTPSLFEKNVIDRNTNHDISDYLRQLSDIKHKELGSDDFMKSIAYDKTHTLLQIRENDTSKKIGVFHLPDSNESTSTKTFETKNEVEVPVADGEYTNLINNQKVTVVGGKINGVLPIVII